MRTLFFALISSLILFTNFNLAAYDGSDCTVDDNSHYVVIGAFALQKNAIRFTETMNREHYAAQFEINQSRKLYYVYVLNTSDRAQAIAEANRLRQQTKFKDTWVFNGPLGDVHIQSNAGVDINPTNQTEMVNVHTEDHKQELITKDPIINTVDQPSAPNKASIQSNSISGKLNEKSKVDSKNFFFKLYRSTDSDVVEGEVDIIDMDKTKRLGSYKGNSTVSISNPANTSGIVSAVCEIFGYRKEQKNLHYANPEGENISIDESGNVVVPFELVRLQKGDIAVMYNVYFFKDAAVMRPESRYEVTSLLEMLKENLNYKIKIHGHTNGGAHGKIISMNGDSENFFSLTDTKDGFGSAKKLSLERADVIKAFLVSNGIDEKRMVIKPWGGKRPIHDKHHTRASENVRVEIEILED
jgi:outer membrane protein OmpA-like peptidoglycan-associated protein